MNEVQEQIYRAVDILGDALKDTLQYDRTYPATITEIVDPLLGQYRVRYENSNILARSRSLSDKYRINDVVFVTEPAVHCADVDTNFYIIGKVKNSALDAADITALQNYTIPVSTNLLEGIVPINYIDGNKTEQQNGLIAGCTPLALTAAVTPLTWDESFKITPIIKLEAEFRTELQSEHASGNYGLRLKFNNDKIYTLDLSSFNGRPYEFNDWAPQSAFFVLEKDMKLTEVEFFQEGMAVDKVWDATSLNWKENTTVPNLFVRNLSLTFVNKKDLTQEEYYLAVSAPQGRYIDENSSITLQARLLNYGEEVTPTTIQWYKKNINIKNSEDAGYDINLGAMWEALEGEIDTTLALAYAENIDKYQTYKVRVTYNGAGYLSDEISVQAFSTNVNDFEIERRMTTEEELFLSPTGDGKWASLINNTYTILNDGGTTNSIQPVDYGMYYAYVSGIGIKSYNYQSREVVIGDVSGDVSVIWSGQTSYLYNAYGMVDDYTITEKVRQLTAAISWNKDKPASYTVAWEYPTENTLLTKVAATTATNADTASISYNIASRYKESTNNKLILRIVTAAGDIYTFEKEILFARNGDPGTNGTGYLVYVRPQGEIYQYLTDTNNIIYEVTAYKNGELTIPSQYVWAGYNVKATGNGATCTVEKLLKNTMDVINQDNPYKISTTAAENTLTKTLKEIVKITGYTKPQVGQAILVNWKETLNNEDNQTSDEVTYWYYLDNYDKWYRVQLNDGSPVLSEGCSIKVAVTIDGQIITAFCPVDVALPDTTVPSGIDYSALPRYVQYNAAGYNPIWDNSPIDAVLSEPNDLLTLSNGQIVPINTYNYSRDGAKVGAVNVDNKVRHSIVYYLNVYGNENINGWDGQVLIDKNNNCIYAAQVGAGYKNNDNQFSGVVMGKAALPGEAGDIKTGLYGFRNGEATFGFREDGTGFIGKSGSRITLNENGQANITLPSTGYISFGSGGFATASNLDKLAEGEYIPPNSTTFICGKKIYSPEIYTDLLTIQNKTKTSEHKGTSGLQIESSFDGGNWVGLRIMANSENISFLNPDGLEWWYSDLGRVNLDGRNLISIETSRHRNENTDEYVYDYPEISFGSMTDENTGTVYKPIIKFANAKVNFTNADITGLTAVWG